MMIENCKFLGFPMPPICDFLFGPRKIVVAYDHRQKFVDQCVFNDDFASNELVLHHFEPGRSSFRRVPFDIPMIQADRVSDIRNFGAQLSLFRGWCHACHPTFCRQAARPGITDNISLCIIRKLFGAPPGDALRLRDGPMAELDRHLHDYLSTGRRFGALDVASLEQRWLPAAEKARRTKGQQCADAMIEMNHIEAELQLRGLKPPAAGSAPN
jgi:hypothetical protein